MDFRGAEEARKRMNVPCEIIRVPQVKLIQATQIPLPVLLDGIVHTRMIIILCEFKTLLNESHKIPISLVE